MALLAQLAVLGAALSYALTNIFASRVSHMPPSVNGAGAMIGAAIWTVPASLIVDRPWTLNPSALSLAAILYLALVSTAAANLIYFRLLRAAGPAFVSQVNFLIPVMGVFWGWLILSEQIGWPALAALALILSGIALSRYGVRRQQAHNPRTSAIE